jgi:uncharacterized protein (TIGR03086 family)
MSEASERYTRVADGFTRRVAAVSADGWSAPSPCSEWTVRDLVAHVIGVHRRVIATLEGADATEVERNADLAEQWRAATDAVGEAVGDDDRASRVVSGMFGEQPFESLVGRLVCSDTLVHTWDLARATGQDERLDSGAVSKSMEFLAPLDEAIRRPGGFATRITPAPGADEQTRFLNFCGRAV